MISCAFERVTKDDGAIIQRADARGEVTDKATTKTMQSKEWETPTNRWQSPCSVIQLGDSSSSALPTWHQPTAMKIRNLTQGPQCSEFTLDLLKAGERKGGWEVKSTTQQTLWRSNIAILYWALWGSPALPGQHHHAPFLLKVARPQPGTAQPLSPQWGCKRLRGSALNPFQGE